MSFLAATTNSATNHKNGKYLIFFATDDILNTEQHNLVIREEHMANVQNATRTTFGSTLSLKHKEGRNPTLRTPRQQGQALGSRPFAPQYEQPAPPPDMLVQTWSWMWRSAQDPEVSREGKQRLINVFGSIEVASAYIAAMENRA